MFTGTLDSKDKIYPICKNQVKKKACLLREKYYNMHKAFFFYVK